MSELSLQKTVVQLLLWEARAKVVWFHVPNGESRSPRTGARLKQMGVRAGVADLCIILPSGLVHFLELKAPKGKQSKPQKDFQAQCEGCGVPYAVASSFEEAEAILRRWGALKQGWMRRTV